MKFTNGFWLVRREYQPIYAVEYDSHIAEGDVLTVYAASKHITSRGDCMNIGMITVRLESPVRDIIRVELEHYDGGPEPIRVKTAQEPHRIDISETDEELIYKSGDTKAVISKRPGDWKISYYYRDKLMTYTGYRNMACMQNKETDQDYMVEQLSLDISETVYGLGERYTPFVKNGQSVGIWNEDGGTASEQTYKNVPFYVSSKGYGILVDSYGDLEFEIASEKVENVQFSVKGEKLAYFVIGADHPKRAVGGYCRLAGMPALPPAWTFGLWLSTSFTTDYDEATTSSFIQGMADREIPLHVFHFDCYWMRKWHWCDFIWDPEAFPDPQGLIKRYHERGLKICVWLNPYIAQQSCLFKEGKENGYLVKKTDGSVWQTDLWQPGLALVDFTNPEAAKWYCSKLEQLLDIGVDCFKTDFGERIPVKDIAWHRGEPAIDMHNYYTYLYNQAVFGLLEEKKGKGEAVLFARSATIGSQQFPVHWGGDCSATYSSMAETLRGGLSLASCGFGFWSHDISGFEQTAPPDIYKRWCQFGLLSSHSRLHGSSSYRVPWLFDDEASVVLKELVELKCSLMPYLYSKAVEAHTEGVPMMRPMYMEFPGDRSCAPLDTQYMMGDTLLVAPIFNAESRAEYYLPEGEWINLFDRRVVKGGTWRTEIHDYHSLPLMVRQNSILPVGSCKTKPEYDYADGVTLYLSQFEDGGKAKIQIPDIKGQIVMTAEAERKGNTIIVRTDGGKNWSVSMLSGEARIIRKGDVVTVEL